VVQHSVVLSRYWTADAKLCLTQFNACIHVILKFSFTAPSVEQLCASYRRPLAVSHHFRMDVDRMSGQILQWVLLKTGRPRRNWSDLTPISLCHDLKAISLTWQEGGHHLAVSRVDWCWHVAQCVFDTLTLWRPLLPYGYSYKASCARPDKAVICIFWHPGTPKLRAEHQTALSMA